MAEPATQAPGWFTGVVVPAMQIAAAIAGVVGVTITSTELSGLIAYGGMAVIGGQGLWTIIRAILARRS